MVNGLRTIALPVAPRNAFVSALAPSPVVELNRAVALAMRDVPPSGWGPRPVTYTARGKAEADAFQMWSPADNPRSRNRSFSAFQNRRALVHFRP